MILSSPPLFLSLIALSKQPPNYHVLPTTPSDIVELPPPHCQTEKRAVVLAIEKKSHTHTFQYITVSIQQHNLSPPSVHIFDSIASAKKTAQGPPKMQLPPPLPDFFYQAGGMLCVLLGVGWFLGADRTNFPLKMAIFSGTRRFWRRGGAGVRTLATKMRPQGGKNTRFLGFLEKKPPHNPPLLTPAGPRTALPPAAAPDAC